VADRSPKTGPWPRAPFEPRDPSSLGRLLRATPHSEISSHKRTPSKKRQGGNHASPPCRLGEALKDIPQELLQADTLTQKTDTGWTVIHWAEAKGQLHHLPKGRLSMSQIKTLLAGTSQTDKPSDYLKAWLKEEKKLQIKLQIQQSLSEWDHPAI